MSDVFGVSGIAQAAGSVASAGIQASAISDAATKAQDSATQAQTLLQGRYDTTRGDLLPYNQIGQTADQQIGNNLALYGTPDNTDINAARGYFNQAATLGSGPGAQAALAATPGYQFTLAQGLQANQNAMAAKGLGVSGAAMKGAATYATGLANQTYGDQFNRLVASGTNSLAANTATQGNLTNSFNRLLGTSQLGENAASQTGTTGASLGNAAAGAITAGGAAGAAGSIATGNALAGGVNGVTNAFSQYQAQQAYGGAGSSANSPGYGNTSTSYANSQYLSQPNDNPGGI
jgi:hypothetical protein